MRTILLMLFAVFLSLPAFAGVNINTATQSELTSLPGIGDSKAAAIIEYRRQNGAFASVDQLTQVSGIGAKTLETLRSQAEVGDGRTVEVGGVPGAAPAPPTGPVVDINSASVGELDSLPGIGPSKAAAIIADREANGRYSSCNELTRVQGVGAKTVATLASKCAAK